MEASFIFLPFSAPLIPGTVTWMLKPQGLRKRRIVAEMAVILPKGLTFSSAIHVRRLGIRGGQGLGRWRDWPLSFLNMAGGALMPCLCSRPPVPLGAGMRLGGDPRDSSRHLGMPAAVQTSVYCVVARNKRLHAASRPQDAVALKVPAALIVRRVASAATVLTFPLVHHVLPVCNGPGRTQQPPAAPWKQQGGGDAETQVYPENRTSQNQESSW